MNATVTRLPTTKDGKPIRAARRVGRSQAKHDAAVAAAQTPEQEFAAWVARGFAILARGDAEASADMVAALRPHLKREYDQADWSFAQGRRQAQVRRAVHAV